MLWGSQSFLHIFPPSVIGETMISSSHGPDAAIANGVFCLIFSEGIICVFTCARLDFTFIWYVFSDWDNVIRGHLYIMFLKKKMIHFLLGTYAWIYAYVSHGHSPQKRPVRGTTSLDLELRAPCSCWGSMEMLGTEGPVEEWWTRLAAEPPLWPLYILLSLLLSNASQKGLQCISSSSRLQESSCPLVFSRHWHSKFWQHK